MLWLGLLLCWVLVFAFELVMLFAERLPARRSATACFDRNRVLCGESSSAAACDAQT